MENNVISGIRLLVSNFGAIIETMVAHFVCILFTGFVIYTAQPGSSKLAVYIIMTYGHG